MDGIQADKAVWIDAAVNRHAPALLRYATHITKDVERDAATGRHASSCG